MLQPHSARDILQKCYNNIRLADVRVAPGSTVHSLPEERFETNSKKAFISKLYSRPTESKDLSISGVTEKIISI